MLERVMDAVEEYNRYRAPEAVARLLRIDDRSMTLEFTGSFCATCGFYDYFDDLRVMLEERGLRCRVSSIKETEDGTIVEFVLEG